MLLRGQNHRGILMDPLYSPQAVSLYWHVLFYSFTASLRQQKLKVLTDGEQNRTITRQMSASNQCFSFFLFFSLSDPGCVPVRMGWCAAAGVFLCARPLPASVCDVCVSSTAPPAVSPRLAVCSLRTAGHQQRLPGLSAHDPGCGQSAATTKRAGRWVLR